MAKIQIDEGWLLQAFEGNDGTMSWYLDLETGDVNFRTDDDDFDDLNDFDDEADEGGEIGRDEEEDGDETGSARDEGEERYIPIPWRDSRDGFRLMERFVGTVEEPRIRDALYEALERRRPFRSFKDALMAYPAVRDRWFAYEEADTREEAIAWLENLGIEYELVPHMSKEPPLAG
ncbi:MAG: hypothetical protein JO306_04085 [Gemmatimonadetes bacterium]|nr:hypothetical protein [Gemmatimonadota bacterium]